MPLEIVHGPVEHNLRRRVNIPRLAQETAPPAQNIEVRLTVCRIPACYVRFLPVFHKHETHNKGDDPTSHHNKFHRDISGFAEPNAIIL